MRDTPGEPAIDVERLVEQLKERAERERAAGAYADDLSGVELVPSELGERFDLGADGRIRFRPELGFSSKPVIGPVITLFKKFLLRTLFFVLDDLARQTDAAVRRLEAALSAEIAARENAEADLAELEARVARLEKGP
jgi:hypothetical protein